LRLIDYRRYQDLDDYLSRCERVRAIIPSLESFYKWSDTELERLRINHNAVEQAVEDAFEKSAGKSKKTPPAKKESKAAKKAESSPD
jgi:uncharacterized protein YdaU (DUF1376 family)